MGFTFRKSFTLPGGFRINLSKSGVGASWGVKGLRVGTGPKGPRLSAYLPGTGIGYTTSLGGGSKKAQPSSSGPATAPGTAREQSAAFPAPAAADAVAAYEAHIAGLTALHREASAPLDWAAIAAAPAPPNDPAHQGEAERWTWWTRVARGIQEGDLDAYDAILDHASPLGHIEAIGTVTEAAARSPWLGEVRLRAHGPEIVPAEALSITKTGKLSTRKLAAGRALALYQDHLCSAAFRVARELFSALPFEVALVHLRTATLDTATGHDSEQTVLSVAVSREELGKLDLARIDPSDALARFPHAMDFSPRTGLAPVEEIRIEDLPGDHAA